MSAEGVCGTEINSSAANAEAATAAVGDGTIFVLVVLMQSVILKLCCTVRDSVEENSDLVIVILSLLSSSSSHAFKVVRTALVCVGPPDRSVYLLHHQW